MDLARRIKAFEQLGQRLRNELESPSVGFERALMRASNENAWFTPESLEHAVRGVAHMLHPEKLDKWLAAYNRSLLDPSTPKKAGLILAGNIPLVGFHDILCVLISGNTAMLKASKQDQALPKYVLDVLIEIEPQFAPHVVWHDHLLSGFTHVIATGSNNTSRYFESYFAKYPHIIRKNRNAVAVLNGTETADQLHALGRDIFRFFGLGCRNVSKVYVPVGFDITTLLAALEGWKDVINHHKYHNNYDYQRAILLVEKIHHIDNGFLLLRESDAIPSAVSMLHYSTYADPKTLAIELAAKANQIQCIVGAETIDGQAMVPFGAAQTPDPWDYADGVDTLRFLVDN